MTGKRISTVLMLLRVIGEAGGIEAALIDLVRDLVARGHRVIVYSGHPPDSDNPNAHRLREAGAELLAAPAWLAKLADPPSGLGQVRLKRLLRWLAPLRYSLAAFDALFRRRSFQRALRGVTGRLRRSLAWMSRPERLLYLPLDLRRLARQVDLVHVHGWGCGADPPGALRWCDQRALPAVYTEHNSPCSADAKPHSDALLNLADVVIACSRAGKRGLVEVCCASREPVVIPYGVADPSQGIELPEPEPRPVTLTCLARLQIEQKGQDVLLLAMPGLLERHPTTRLLLAGDGPSRAGLELLAQELGIQESVEFLGNVPRSRLGWLMSESDIMVLPSMWEGLPVSIIESMAFGKPVVASDAGGSPELVADGETGFVVPKRDTHALASALTRLIEQPELRKRMGTAARQRYIDGGFAPDAVAQATLAAYAAAAEHRLSRLAHA